MTFHHPSFDPSPHAKKRRHLYAALALVAIASLFTAHEIVAKFVELQVGAILYFLFFGAFFE